MVKRRKLKLKRELLVTLTTSVRDATRSSECGACSCEQWCEQ